MAEVVRALGYSFSSSKRRPLSRRQPGQPPSGASAGISQPHFGQILSALIIIGESLVHAPPLLLRKILSKVTPEPQQLNAQRIHKLSAKHAK